MKTLTVITTTYNRANIIGRLYDSLKRQTCRDFVWLVVDDGSSDNTKEVIEGFIAESLVDITYIYQTNKGMHGARNTAYENVKTEINTIIDDDDYMTDDAVEKIVSFWNKNKEPGVAGIVAYDVDLNGKIIGTELPENVKLSTMAELTGKYKMTGDKKLVFISDIIRKNPFPEFPGEKFFPASYKYLYIDLEYKLLLLPEKICVVDCNEASMTYNKVAQYRSCPKGFAFYRNAVMGVETRPKKLLKTAIHYVAESKLAGNKRIIRDAKKKLYVILAYPVGIALYFYIKKTNKKAIGVKKH